MKREPDYENMSVFDQVMEGIKQGTAHARGELTLRTITLPAPAPALTKKRVILIRKKLEMSQAVLARMLNVPTKTLQSWEQGARKPKAGEARLLQMFEACPAECLALIHRANAAIPAAPQKRAARRTAVLF